MIDYFCYTKNPKKPEFAIIPFVCYDFQRPAIEELQRAIKDGYDILLEKSRDMGHHGW